MASIWVHPRVAERHPELSEQDVIGAMKTAMAYRQRETGEWVAVGFDQNGRMVECVYVYDEAKEDFGVYHAMTPPSAKVLTYLGLLKR